MVPKCALNSPNKILLVLISEFFFLKDQLLYKNSRAQFAQVFYPLMKGAEIDICFYKESQHKLKYQQPLSKFELGLQSFFFLFDNGCYMIHVSIEI